MATIARVLRFAAALGFVGCALPAVASAGTLTATMLGSGPGVALTPGSAGSVDSTASGGALRVIGGTSNAVAIPLSGASGIAPTGVASFNAPVSVNGNVNAGGDSSRGPDQKWGDPLSAGLYDSDSVHAGLNYYYSSGRDGSEGAVGFSLTFH